MARKISDDVKAKAVRLAEEHIRVNGCSAGQACVEVSAMVGVSYHSVRRWLQDSRRQARLLSEVSDGDLVAENRRLRGRVAELERANEILKAASAFFAAELDRPDQ